LSRGGRRELSPLPSAWRSCGSAAQRRWAGLVRYVILAELHLQIRKLPPYCVKRHAVVHRRIEIVGLVVLHHDVAGRAQSGQYAIGAAAGSSNKKVENGKKYQVSISAKLKPGFQQGVGQRIAELTQRRACCRAR